MKKCHNSPDFHAGKGEEANNRPGGPACDEKIIHDDDSPGRQPGKCSGIQGEVGRKECLPPRLAGPSLLGRLSCPTKSLQTDGDLSQREPVSQDIGNGEITGNETGAARRNGKKEGGSWGTESEKVTPVQEKIKGMTISRELCHPEKTSRSPFIGKEGSGRNPSARR
jgi:hypothetical protein